MSYLKITEEHRSSCREYSRQRLPHLGKHLPICVNELDILLPELANVSCCKWSCPGQSEPHVLEHMLGKGVSQTLAGLELSFSGHYDEAFVLARSVGEAANLAWLFWLEPNSFDEWCSCEGWDRWNKFKPSKVRKKITALNKPVPIDETRYSILSQETTHPKPHSPPQNYNKQIPTLGGFYQEAGFISSLNELAAPIAVLGGTVVKLIENLPPEQATNISNQSSLVLRNIGAFDLKKSTEVAR